MKDLKEFLQESILDSIKPKLSSDLWSDEGKLKKSAKTVIIKRLENWLKAYTNKNFKHLFVLGSMAGYQYNDTADIDVNFVIDLPDERIKEMAKLMAIELNEKNLPGTKHPINYYITNKIKKEWAASGPVYDILKDKWVVKPKKEPENTPITNYRAVIEIARYFMAGLDSIISEYNADVAAYETYKQYIENVKEEENRKALEEVIRFKLQEIVSDMDGIEIAYYLIHGFRKEAFNPEKGPYEIHTKIDIQDSQNNSINNLIYKYLERLGYFKKIKNILDEKDRWISKLDNA